jgi:hypothetical protein
LSGSAISPLVGSLSPHPLFLSPLGGGIGSIALDRRLLTQLGIGQKWLTIGLKQVQGSFSAFKFQCIHFSAFKANAQPGTHPPLDRLHRLQGVVRPFAPNQLFPLRSARSIFFMGRFSRVGFHG